MRFASIVQNKDNASSIMKPQHSNKNTKSTPAAADKKIVKRNTAVLSPNDDVDQKKTRTLSVESAGADESFSMEGIESAACEAAKISLQDSQLKQILGTLSKTFEAQLPVMVNHIVTGVLSGLQSRISDLEDENASLRDHVAVLEQRVEQLELAEERSSQYSRRNCLRVSGIVEKGGEQIDDVVAGLIKDLDVDVHVNEIDRAHRLGRQASDSGKKRPRDIIIKFATYRARQKLYKRRTQLRRSDKYKGTFINEELTRKRSELFYNARQLVKDKHFGKSWTSDGIVFIEDLQGRIHKCETQKDLDKCK